MWFGLITILITSLVLVGCERLAPFKIENKTSEVLTVYIDDHRIGDVKPNAKIKNNLVWAGSDWYLIEAYDTQGNVVYSHKLSREEVRKIDWKVVIPPLED